MHRTGRGWKSRAKTLAILLILLPASADAGERPPLRLTLQECVDLALEHNEDLQMARHELRRASAQIREARAAALPQIDLSVGYTRNWQLPTFVFDTLLGRQQVEFGARDELVGALDLKQPLYTSGKVGAALQIARLFASYATEQLRSVRQQIRSGVEVSFYELLLARELVRVSDRAQARARAHLEQVESLWRGGQVSDYDLTRAQVQVVRTRPDSLQARNGVERAEIGLKDLLGIDPERHVLVEGAFDRAAPLTGDRPAELCALAAERRPEMRQARLQIQMRAQAVRIARSAARPALEMNARGQAQLQGDDLALWAEEMQHSLGTGLSLKIPVFDGRRTDAQTAQARQDENSARLAADRLGRAIEMQVRQVWLLVREAEARLRAQQAVLGQAENGLRLAASRYAQGSGTHLEVLDAELLLIRAQTERARARRDRAVALVMLETAVGIIGESR